MDGEDNPVAMFMSVTDTSYEVALQALERADFDVQRAIEVYLSGGDAMPPAGSHQDDEELARQLQREQEEEAAKRAASQDEVREAIPEFQDTLVGDGFDHGVNNFGARRQPEPSYQSAFLQNISRDFQREAENSESREKSARLAEMYKPPLEIMFRGTFEEAKHEAEQRGKWLLVNLQKEDEFSCHRLNRDVFRNESLQELIKMSYVFWQMDVSHDRGKQYQTYYKAFRFPHIGIIDAVTGMLMKKMEGEECLTSDLGTILSEWLERPQDRPNKKVCCGIDGAPEADAVRDRPMSEDEQIQAALAASLESGGPSQPAAASAPTAAAKAEAYILPEPDLSHPDTTRLQFRMPDGGQIVRAMKKSMMTKDVYAFLRATVHEATDGDKTFEAVMFPNTVLPDDETTLEQAGAVHAVVQMRWCD